MIRVLFFGRLREIAGGAECVAPQSFSSLKQLRDHLMRENPALGEALCAPGVRFAVDGEFAHIDATLADAREVACMSALSGG